LRDDYANAWHAVNDAVDALRKVEFNARDYYVQGPDAFTKAQKERAELFAKLEAVKADLMAHMESIENQIEEREARRTK
jgi:hypothetical protein